MRIMGLDYGSVTVGVAVSDGLLLTAQPVEVIKRKSETKLRQTLARIEALIAEYEVEKIVLGLPKNMNNTSGERVQKTEEFKEKLEKRTGLEVIFWDERFSGRCRRCPWQSAPKAGCAGRDSPSDRRSRGPRPR